MSKPFVNLHLSRPITVIDLETTGLSPSRDRIVEVAAIRFLPDGSRAKFHRLINPGVPMPQPSTAIHGISDDDLRGCPEFKAIAAGLIRFIGNSDLCGFGIARFDLPFLMTEFTRAGFRFTINGRAVIDVLRIFHERERRDLSAAVRHYLGREHASSHEAFADAYAAAAILDAQVAKYEDLPRSPAELHATLTNVDLAGRLRLENGAIVFNFGKHLGRPLHEVAQDDPDYLRWLLQQDFLPDFHAFVRRALEDM
jgi:DNA polymerase-3 subunit epsilon